MVTIKAIERTASIRCDNALLLFLPIMALPTYPIEHNPKNKINCPENSPTIPQILSNTIKKINCNYCFFITRKMNANALLHIFLKCVFHGYFCFPVLFF